MHLARIQNYYGPLTTLYLLFYFFSNDFALRHYSMSVPPLYEAPSVWVSDNFYLIQDL